MAGKILSRAVDGFDLDPCAATSDRRRARVKRKILLTETDDGLWVPSTGRCFVEPALWQEHRQMGPQMSP